MRLWGDKTRELVVGRGQTKDASGPSRPQLWRRCGRRGRARCTWAWRPRRAERRPGARRRTPAKRPRGRSCTGRARGVAAAQVGSLSSAGMYYPSLGLRRRAALWTTKVHARCRQAVFSHPIGIGLAGMACFSQRHDSSLRSRSVGVTMPIAPRVGYNK